MTSIAKGGRNECSDCWQWGIRATPIIGLITLIALIFGVEEPVWELKLALIGYSEADVLELRISSQWVIRIRDRIST